MELRPELMPPVLDEAMIAHLGKLASAIDGARPGEWEDKLPEFNRLAGTAFGHRDFQGIYGAEDHESFVRRVLVRRRIHPVPDVTRDELIEVVRRAMPQNGDPDYEAYMAIFDANVPMADASLLIYYPFDWDGRTNTWGGGRQMSEYDPTPEQVVDWAMTKSTWPL